MGIEMTLFMVDVSRDLSLLFLVHLDIQYISFTHRFPSDMHMEYARDIEIQTPTFLTTQENLAAYINRVWNKPDLIQEYGKPVCIISAGLHDAGIKDISTGTYVQNVKFMLDLFIPVCEHIIWLGNTAPAATNASSPKYKQTIALTKSWNEAVIELIGNETTFSDRMSFVDVHEASLKWPHVDHIHLSRDWYNQLGNEFFLPLISSTSRSGVIQQTKTVDDNIQRDENNTGVF